MIELRWRNFKEHAGTGLPGWQRVLQFRVNIGATEEPTGRFPEDHEWAGEPMYGAIWSEWKDVPEVIEQLAAPQSNTQESK